MSRKTAPVGGSPADPRVALHPPARFGRLALERPVAAWALGSAALALVFTVLGLLLDPHDRVWDDFLLQRRALTPAETIPVRLAFVAAWAAAGVLVLRWRLRAEAEIRIAGERGELTGERLRHAVRRMQIRRSVWGTGLSLWGALFCHHLPALVQNLQDGRLPGPVLWSTSLPFFLLLYAAVSAISVGFDEPETAAR